MQILILGASGMIGSRITTEALSRGHKVTGTARNPGYIDEKATRVALDISRPDGLPDLVAAADVVVVAISPRSSGDVSADIGQIADAIEQVIAPAGTRMIHVGGAGSMNLPDGSPVADVVPEIYRAEAQAMRKAYERLAPQDFDYTFIAPASIIAPGTRTGSYRAGGRQVLTATDGGPSTISAEDYAVAVLDEIETGKRRGQIFQVAN